MVYENMKRQILAKGGKVVVDTAVKKVLTNNGIATGIERENGERKMVDEVISSMPLRFATGFNTL